MCMFAWKKSRPCNGLAETYYGSLKIVWGTTTTKQSEMLGICCTDDAKVVVRNSCFFLSYTGFSICSSEVKYALSIMNIHLLKSRNRIYDIRCIISQKSLIVTMIHKREKHSRLSCSSRKNTTTVTSSVGCEKNDKVTSLRYSTSSKFSYFSLYDSNIYHRRKLLIYV